MTWLSRPRKWLHSPFQASESDQLEIMNVTVWPWYHRDQRSTVEKEEKKLESTKSWSRERSDPRSLTFSLWVFVPSLTALRFLLNSSTKTPKEYLTYSSAKLHAQDLHLFSLSAVFHESLILQSSFFPRQLFFLHITSPLNSSRHLSSIVDPCLFFLPLLMYIYCVISYEY